MQCGSSFKAKLQQRSSFWLQMHGQRSSFWLQVHVHNPGGPQVLQTGSVPIHLLPALCQPLHRASPSALWWLVERLHASSAQPGVQDKTLQETPGHERRMTSDTPSDLKLMEGRCPQEGRCPLEHLQLSAVPAMCAGTTAQCLMGGLPLRS